MAAAAITNHVNSGLKQFVTAVGIYAATNPKFMTMINISVM